MISYYTNLHQYIYSIYIEIASFAFLFSFEVDPGRATHMELDLSLAFPKSTL